MKNNNFSLRKLFANNKFSLAFSIIAAVVLWMVITVVQAPDTEKTVTDVPVNIPIEGSALSQLGLDVVDSSALNNTVSVTIKGANYIVSGISAEDITVTASISNVTAPGKYTLELKAVKSLGGDYEIASIFPSSVVVSFDYIDTKEFTVKAEAPGISAVKGLVAEPAVVTDSNSKVLTVKGPRANMEKLSEVVASTDETATLGETASYNANIKLLDQSGNVLDKTPFKISAADGTLVDTISISVPISKMKEVPIEVTFKNEPYDGFGKTLVNSLSSKTVTILGPEKTVDSINSILLEPIDFNEISPSKYQFNVKPAIPDGISFAETLETVTVTFKDVKNYTVKTFTVSSFNGTGGNGSLKTPIKNVKICGPKSAVNSLSAESLVATANISGKTPGDHSIDVIIKDKSGKTWQVGTYTATISIK